MSDKTPDSYKLTRAERLPWSFFFPITPDVGDRVRDVITLMDPEIYLQNTIIRILCQMLIWSELPVKTAWRRIDTSDSNYNFSHHSSFYDTIKYFLLVIAQKQLRAASSKITIKILVCSYAKMIRSMQCLLKNSRNLVLECSWGRRHRRRKRRKRKKHNLARNKITRVLQLSM